MNQKDIRWKQRYQNFKKSFDLLDTYTKQEEYTEIERAGLIQFFKMSFELSWKVMKDYLESQGFIINSPRDTIKQAFQANIISNGEVWIEALADRNLTVHTYDETTAEQILEKIKKNYYPLLKRLDEYLTAELKK
ncbi:MAG: nucleotidyltransferase substrate binding protein [Rhodothermaceae bacterium]